MLIVVQTLQYVRFEVLRCRGSRVKLLNVLVVLEKNATIFQIVAIGAVRHFHFDFFECILTIFYALVEVDCED